MADGAPPSWRRRLVRRVLLPGALLGLVAVGAGNAYLFATTAKDIVDTVAAAPSRPVAIVLGNSVWPGGVLSWGLAARVRVALALYEAGKVQRLFLSGAFRTSDGYDEPGAMAAWLEKRGVPRTAMVLDRLGHRTAATMANAAAQGFFDALICTQSSHMPRALYFARHAGIRATGVRGLDPTGLSFDRGRGILREALARPEAVVEVALRGVSAD
jgi:vancomycin permeability regulator SanA